MVHGAAVSDDRIYSFVRVPIPYFSLIFDGCEYVLL